MNELFGDRATNVFINCPFDKDFHPIQHAIMFTVSYLGLKPLLASLSVDSGANRLDGIRILIENSKYSIHDLSLARAKEAGEVFRMNMPFELGIDDGCRNFGGERFQDKVFLVLEGEKYLAKQSLSDLAGCDFECHNGNFQNVIKIVRNWLYNVADTKDEGARRIADQYAFFQEWYFEKKLAGGAAEQDILEFPTREFLDGIMEWNESGRPITFN